jgi:hypothetical protein
MAESRKLPYFTALLLYSTQLLGQNFGSSYDFLLKETNARIAALGGVNASLRDEDVQLGFGNPAAINGKMAKSVGMTVNPGLGGTVQYNLAYADSGKKMGPWFAGLQFLDYGKLRESDVNGVRLGEFQASQYAIGFGTSRKKGNFHLGIYGKWIGFQVFGDQAYALAFDLGAHYQHPKKSMSYGLTIRNLGATLRKFEGVEQSMPLPLNIQASLSYKLEHMPLRLSINGFYFQETDIQYLDPSDPGKLDPNGNLVREKKKITEQIARHLGLGGEFLLHRSFHLRFGYNHLRRKELRTDAGAGLTGFSLGCMINTKPLNLSYTYSGWQPSGGQHFITLNCRLNQFYNKN